MSPRCTLPRYTLLRFIGPLAFLLALMLLAGCKPITPPSEAALPQPVSPQVQSLDPLALLEEACKSYMDVDLEQAYLRFEYPIFWTFHTNFYQPYPIDDPRQRLGCLRFYWRDESASPGTFVGTLNSALVIECHSANGDLVTQPMFPSITSSNGIRDDDDPSLPHRRTLFENDAYLECPLDINASLTIVTSTLGFTDDLALLSNSSDVDAVLHAIPEMVATPAQQYGEFMIAAALQSGDLLATDSLLFYEPHL
jgi:hypothetical protein